jgi:hypothetical protein
MAITVATLGVARAIVPIHHARLTSIGLAELILGATKFTARICRERALEITRPIDTHRRAVGNTKADDAATATVVDIGLRINALPIAPGER